MMESKRPSLGQEKNKIGSLSIDDGDDSENVTFIK